VTRLYSAKLLSQHENHYFVILSAAEGSGVVKQQHSAGYKILTTGVLPFALRPCRARSNLSRRFSRLRSGWQFTLKL